MRRVADPGTIAGRSAVQPVARLSSPMRWPGPVTPSSFLPRQVRNRASPLNGELSLDSQAAAGALIAEHLASLGFDGAHALVTDVLELKRYRFLSKGESDEGAVPCPVCGRLTPSPR